MKSEEQKVIENANKRMAEVHARKQAEVSKAAEEIERAHVDAQKRMEEARASERAAIDQVVAKSARNVVA